MFGFKLFFLLFLIILKSYFTWLNHQFPCWKAPGVRRIAGFLQAPQRPRWLGGHREHIRAGVGKHLLSRARIYGSIPIDTITIHLYIDTITITIHLPSIYQFYQLFWCSPSIFRGMTMQHQLFWCSPSSWPWRNQGRKNHIRSDLESHYFSCRSIIHHLLMFHFHPFSIAMLNN